MKKKEFQEFKNKPVAELEKICRESNERLRSLKFDLAAGKVKNVEEVRELRKDVARISTLITAGKNKSR